MRSGFSEPSLRPVGRLLSAPGSKVVSANSGQCPRRGFRLYHRKDGRVVKERDDLMSATRYAIMMLRDAKTLDWYDWTENDIFYPPLATTNA
jgi:hypothetical protein